MIKEWKWVKSDMDERMGLLWPETQQTGSLRHRFTYWETWEVKLLGQIENAFRILIATACIIMNILVK